MILRPCPVPACPELTEGGRCEAHRIARQREIDARRGSPYARGYDADHRRLRVLCFLRDGWRCADCGWEPPIIVDCRRLGLDEPPVREVLAQLRARFHRGERHLHADHQISIQERPGLRLDLGNMRTRCNLCHAAKTMLESVRRDR